MKDAPKFGVSHNKNVCDFIDQYVSCKIPEEDSKLRELVLLLEQHKHSSYCTRNKACCFNFPKPPSSKTLITREDAEPDDVAQAIDVLGKVERLISKGNTDLSLDDLLTKAEVTENGYTSALEVSCAGSVVLCTAETAK